MRWGVGSSWTVYPSCLAFPGIRHGNAVAAVVSRCPATVFMLVLGAAVLIVDAASVVRPRLVVHVIVV